MSITQKYEIARTKFRIFGVESSENSKIPTRKRRTSLHRWETVETAVACRVYTANELDFADGPLSLEAGADCDFSFYRAARPVIGLKGKGDYGFLNIPGEIITRIRNPTTWNRESGANEQCDRRTISYDFHCVMVECTVRKENE